MMPVTGPHETISSRPNFSGAFRSCALESQDRIYDPQDHFYSVSSSPEVRKVITSKTISALEWTVPKFLTEFFFTSVYIP